MVASYLLMWALAQAPDYDAFCDRDGNMVTREHGVALMAMLRRPGEVEAIVADAANGNPRAKRVFETLERDYFPDIGRELAEKVSRPPCLVPAVRELSGWCVPDWAFLDFLRKDQPGGARLRKAFFDGFAERSRQRGLENQLVLSAMNAILGVTVAGAALREAGAAATGPGEAIARGHAFDKHVLEKAEFKELRIETRSDFARLIDEVVGRARGGDVRPLSGGRTAYWDTKTGTVVILNPASSDMGTAFRPSTGRAYFEGLK